MVTKFQAYSKPLMEKVDFFKSWKHLYKYLVQSGRWDLLIRFSGKCQNCLQSLLYLLHKLAISHKKNEVASHLCWSGSPGWLSWHVDRTTYAVQYIPFLMTEAFSFEVSSESPTDLCHFSSVGFFHFLEGSSSAGTPWTIDPSDGTLKLQEMVSFVQTS